MGASFTVTKVLGIGHVIYKEIEKGIFGLINEVAFCVAPFAVVFVEITVRLSADIKVLGFRGAY